MQKARFALVNPILLNWMQIENNVEKIPMFNHDNVDQDQAQIDPNKIQSNEEDLDGLSYALVILTSSVVTILCLLALGIVFIYCRRVKVSMHEKMH